MISVTFFKKRDDILGFEFSGHAMAGEYGTDIVCAAVSSAAYMTANTITDIIGAKADINVGEGSMKLIIDECDAKRCRDILCGLELHIKGIAQEYGRNIKTAVKNI